MGADAETASAADPDSRWSYPNHHRECPLRHSLGLVRGLSTLPARQSV